MATPTNLPATFVAGDILTAAQQNGLRGAFRVLQVVSGTTTTSASSSSATYADTNLTVTITPQSSTSKIFVMVNQFLFCDTASQSPGIRLVRGATTVQQIIDPIFTSGGTLAGSVTIMYLDSPATTSATTYKTTFARNAGSGTFFVQPNNNPANITVFEVSA